MSSVRVKLLFLPSKTTSSAHTSRRQQELDDQEARAHAASIGHRHASRLKGREAAYPGKQMRGTTSRWLLPIRESGLAPQKRDEQRHIQESPGLGLMKTGALDPFFRLPTDLDMRDRNMVFHYLDTTPRIIHGVKQNPVYCPVRACTVVSIAENPLFLQWIILLGEVGTGASEASIFARRAAIYAETRRILQDPANWLLDTTLHVAMAPLAEMRMGNAGLANKHFAGLLQLLKLRNGLRTVQEVGLHLGLGILHAFALGEAPLFQTVGELHAALDRMSLPQGKPVHPRIRKYFRFSSLSGPQICNLHLLNMITMHEPEGYMDRLVHNITGSDEDLRPVALTFMICQSCVEVGGWYGPSPVVKSWETIEFVRLLAYASRSKAAAVEAMSSWLTEPAHLALEIDIGSLKGEILEGWNLAQHLDELSLV